MASNMSEARVVSFDQLFQVLADRIASRLEARLPRRRCRAMRPRLLTEEPEEQAPGLSDEW